MPKTHTGNLETPPSWEEKERSDADACMHPPLLGQEPLACLPLELGDVLEQRCVQVGVVEHRLGVPYLLLGVAQRLLRRHPPVRRLITDTGKLKRIQATTTYGTSEETISVSPHVFVVSRRVGTAEKGAAWWRVPEAPTSAAVAMAVEASRSRLTMLRRSRFSSWWIRRGKEAGRT